MENPPEVKELQKDEYKYKAFISYRHSFRDTIIANYLYQMLVTEKISRSLGQKENKRVYKDEETSNASSDLSESIRLALNESRTLIVIISSQTSKSKWIPQEIGAFLECHPHRRIIFLLTDGELTRVLPETLRYTTVKHAHDNLLTADGGGESWWEGITVLNIHGKNPLDNLRQLKRQRVQLMSKILDCPAESVDYADIALRKQNDRTLKMVIIGSMLVFLASIFLLKTVMENIRDEVLIQQRIAKRCFFELADDLVDYSFRVPRVTQEMEAVFSGDIQQLSEHCRVLQKQKAQAAKDDQAADYALLGNLYLLCGDLPRAIEFHERSLDTGELLTRKQLSFGQIIEATSSLLALGDLWMKQGEYDKAVLEYQKIFSLTDNYQSRELDPDQGLIERIPNYFKNFLIWIHLIEYRQSPKVVAMTLNQNILVVDQRIGEGLYCEGRFAEALNYYSQCYEMLNKIPGAMEKTIQSQLQLISINNRIGNIHYRMWNLGNAFNCYLSSQTALIEILKKAPRYQTAIYHLMLTNEYLGDASLIMGNLKGATGYYEESIRNAQKIMPYLREKMKTYRDLISGYGGLANVRMQTGELGKGMEIYHKIIGMEQELLQKLAGLSNEEFSPKSLEIGKANNSLAYCYLMINDAGKAMEAANQALKVESLQDAALATLISGVLLQGNIPEAKRLLKEASSREQGRIENLKRSCIYNTCNLSRLNPENKSLTQFQNWLVNW